MGKEELSHGIETVVTDLGYECVNVASVTEEGRRILRVMIDSLGGINVRDCEVVSKAVNRYLDGKEARGATEGREWNDRYYLEVSSPGLERPLFTPADYERFKYREARVKTHAPIEGRKTHTGVIRGSDELSVTLETRQGTSRIPFDAVTRATLIFRGLEPQEPKKAPRSLKTNGKREFNATEKMRRSI